MRITSIALKDYRTHTGEKIFEFDRGVNLIIGENGSGKSSILEAIGLALFDGSLRDNLKSAVSRGKKSAVITINFVSDDENRYIVERKIGSASRWIVRREGEKGNIAEGSNAVLSLISELTGIKENSKLVYNSVICATQNRFVDAFSGSPTDREKRFNSLFGTAVYRTLYDHFNSEVGPLKKYNRASDKLTGVLSEQGAQVKDDAPMFEKLNSYEEILSVENQKLLSETDQLKALDNKLKVINDNGLKLNQLESSVNHVSEMIEQKELLLKQNSEKLKLCESAEKILVENGEAYETFERAQKELSDIQKEIDICEVADLKRQKYESELSDLKSSDTVLGVKKDEAEKSREEISKAVEKNRQLLKAGKTKQDGYENEGLENKVKLDSVNEKLLILNRIYDEYQELTSQKELFLLKLEELNKAAISQDDLENEKSSLDLATEKLNEKIDEISQIDREVSSLLAKIEQLTESQAQLSTGICPLLNEECKNISAVSSTDYFSSKINDINLQLKEQRALISAYGDIKGGKYALDRDLANFDTKRLNEERRRESVINLNTEITAANSNINNKFKEIEQVSDIEISNFEEFKKYLESEKAKQIKYADRRERIVERYKEAKAEVTSVTTELNSLIKDLDFADKTIKDLIELVKSNSFKIKGISDLLKGVGESLQNYPKLKSRKSEIDLLMQENRRAHKLFLENRQIASEKEELLKFVAELKNEIDKSRSSLNNENQELIKMKEIFSKDEQSEVTKKLEAAKERERAISEQIIGINSNIEQIKKEIQTNSELKSRIGDTEKSIEILNKKIELTTIFRDNLRGMGRFVAKQVVDKISLDASKNYLVITGRNDRIRWEVEEDNQYAVFLDSGHGEGSLREFSQLSGGEQVTVAIALRASLSTHFGNSFVMFDEPTINLDTDRRVALADSISKILNSVEQVLVVTHDGTFREMAQRVIEL